MFEHGAVAVTLQAADDSQILEPAPGATPIWQATQLVAYLPLATDLKSLKNALEVAEAGRLVDVEFVDDSQLSAAYPPPVEHCFGGRLWLRPKAASARASKGDSLYLDPGLAFGSGSHPTTRMCLEWLATHVTAEQRVLDFGCGSGILLVGAALLGATGVGVDHDPQALVATRDNAAYNAVLDRVEILDVAAWQQNPQASFDVVVANILAAPLCSLAGALQGALRASGHLVLSGLLEDQVGEVMACYSEIEFASPVVDDHWVCLVGSKR